MGREAFLARVGFGGRREMSAKLLALLSLFEPQAGLCLMAGIDRIEGAAEMPEAITATH